MLAGLCIIAYFIQITEALPESVVAIVCCKEQDLQIAVDTMQQTFVQLKEASLRQELQQYKARKANRRRKGSKKADH